jgi:hypothetical protein
MGVLVITCPATGKDLYWNKDRREGSSRLRYAIEFFASLNTGKKNARRRFGFVIPKGSSERSR